MDSFIILLGVVVFGLAVISALFFKEQHHKNETVKKLVVQEDISNKCLIENKDLNTEIRKLSQEVESLKKDIIQKDTQLSQKEGTTTYNIAHLIDETKIKDIMTTKVIGINQNESFGAVARRMKDNNIRHLPVVDDRNKLVGLITQRMLYKIQSPRKLVDGDWYYDEEMLNDIILQHVMEKDVFTLSPDQTLGKALMKMTYSKFGCIPIIDSENFLVGIITRKDILKVAAKIYEKKYTSP